jgi:uncharacterized membrane protein
MVGLQASKKIGLNPTIKITTFGLSFATIFYFRIPTNLLELMLGLTLYYFSFRFFKEALREQEHVESDDKGCR